MNHNRKEIFYQVKFDQKILIYSRFDSKIDLSKESRFIQKYRFDQKIDLLKKHILFEKLSI